MRSPREIRIFSRSYLLPAMMLLAFVPRACQRFEPQSEIVIATGDVETLVNRQYKLNGYLVSLGKESMSEHGFCWSETRMPDVDASTSLLGPKDSRGGFTSTIQGLQAGTTYYVRAFATYGSEPVYGNEKSFTTADATLPSVTTTLVTQVTRETASSGGQVTDDGGAAVTARGVCWSTQADPDIQLQSKTTDGFGTGTYTSDLTGLECNTRYFVRAYATNEVGTAYGLNQEFTTLACPAGLPTVSTAPVTEIDENSAKGGGEVSDEGTSAVTARGVCWSTAENPRIEWAPHSSDGSGSGSFTSMLTGLECNTKYYVRAYATNASGTAYGLQEEFTTLSCPVGLPTVSTLEITSYTETTAQGGGLVSDEGGAAVTARGVCWSTSRDPRIDTAPYTTDGAGAGSYTSAITGLDCSTRYFVRAYATNSVGTAYGDNVEFTTSSCPVVLPTVTTRSIDAITADSARGGGEVLSNGGGTVTARGVCWGTGENPEIDSDPYTIEGSGLGSFTCMFGELECETGYYVRAFATNSAGTAYGDNVQFTAGSCPVQLPTVVTDPTIYAQTDSAEGGGNVTDEGGAPVTARGVCWGTSLDPEITTEPYSVDGSGQGSYRSLMTPLTRATSYYVRAYATNSAGTAYGDNESFQTRGEAPTVTTADITNITAASATSGGNITDDGGLPITARGVCWDTVPFPDLPNNCTSDGTGSGSYTSTISGLDPITTYYVRAYATNSEGTSYGEEKEFETPWTNSNIADREGHVYRTVQIGDQVWMKDNLQATQYADGTPIPHASSSSAWSALGNTGKGYCYYDNNSSYADEYGALYTWATVMNGAATSDENPSGVRGVCPDGWHVPSHSEWIQLEVYLGMDQQDAETQGWRGTSEGGMLKETLPGFWNEPNTGATNSSGFSAIPGGDRSPSGGFTLKGVYAYFWTATGTDAGNAWYRSLGNEFTTVYAYPYEKPFGFSIRCVKDR